MKKSLKLLAIPLIIALGYFVFSQIVTYILSGSESTSSEAQQITIGEELTSYRSVSVYQNGSFVVDDHGKHYSREGYYYGLKWQCVEFVKRFYFKAYHHRMPSVWGHAKSFFDPSLPHATLNPQRGMIQFQNGGTTSPRPDDLLVFRGGTYGHVAVICAVRHNEIEVVQQNVLGKTRQTFPLIHKNSCYTIGQKNRPAGWLRIAPKE